MGIRGNWEKRRVGTWATLGEIDRRTFVKLSGASAAALVFGLGPYTETSVAQSRLPDGLFKIGVASGDPEPDKVILWTRLAPQPLEPDGGMPNGRVDVRWEVSRNENFSRVVKKGTAAARPEQAHSVHVGVKDLEPATEYFYRFKAGNETSAVGRTKTAPRGEARLDRLAFAFASCQMYEHGYYHAYRDMSRQDLDLVFHLGDYIYEYEPVTGYPSPTGNVRLHVPASETDRLGEYRVRHAQYRTDADLQAAHAACPWVVTWDDHEVENNYADEISEDNVDPEGFLERRAAAYQAYYEHMPLAMRSVPRGPGMRLYRRFTYGRLARFNVLDTRQYRDDQANDDGLDPPDAETRDPRRTLTGDRQERWMLDGLANSGSTWNVLAQQIFFAELDLNPAPTGALYSMDAWDGYEGQRNRIVEFLERRKVSNPVVLTGDVHMNWANDIKRDFDAPRSRTIGTEYVGTSISSNGNGTGMTSTSVPDNPHIKFLNDDRGYVLCNLTPREWTTRYRVVKIVNVPEPQPAVTLATFVTESGNPGAQLDGSLRTPQTASPDIQEIERRRIEAQR